MKIKVSKTTKLLITDVKALDPVTVFLEDFEPRQGKITIECYGKSWSSCWIVNDQTIAEFFVSCDNGYLSTNLSSISSSIPDNKALPARARKFIRHLRRNNDISHDTAREWFDEADQLSDGWQGYERYMYDVFGEGWWYYLPEKENPDYEYLCRIINAVRDGLREYIDRKVEVKS